ncbi:MAG: hypothetical protein H6874_10405 [Hyphomicrobiaceae bacterium]|nr:hypothetical protein [Hyphomicrobiaceae bacterium]
MSSSSRIVAVVLIEPAALQGLVPVGWRWRNELPLPAPGVGCAYRAAQPLAPAHPRPVRLSPIAGLDVGFVVMAFSGSPQIWLYPH